MGGPGHFNDWQYPRNARDNPEEGMENDIRARFNAWYESGEAIP